MTARRPDPDLGVGRAPGTGPGGAVRASGWRAGRLSPAVLLLAGVMVALLVTLLVIAIAGSGTQHALGPQQQQRLDQLTVGNGQTLLKRLSH